MSKIDSRPQLRPTCNQKIVEAKRRGHKIPEVINGIKAQPLRFNSRTGPFEEDMDIQEVDAGPQKIPSWAPDEEDEAAGTGQWEDSHAFEVHRNTLQQSASAFQTFQQPRKASPFQQQGTQLGAFQQQNAFSGNSSQAAAFPSPKQPSPFQTAKSPFGGPQQPMPQQPLSAFQQAMAKFPKPTSVFQANIKPTAPAFQPSALQTPAGNAFSQAAPAFTAPAFSAGTGNVFAAGNFGNAFSAQFGKQSSPAPSEGAQDPRATNQTASPSNVFAAPTQQSWMPPSTSATFGFQSTDHSEGYWQQEEQYEVEERGEEEYYEEYLGGHEEDDEFAAKQADLERRQEEVTQRQAEISAKLEAARRELAEKQMEQQRRKGQSELRHRLLKHRLENQVAQAQQQQQQEQHSLFQQPLQAPQSVVQQASSELSPSFTSPPTSTSPISNVFAAPPASLGQGMNALKMPQPSPGLGRSIASELEQGASEQQHERNINLLPEVKDAPKEPEREPSPPIPDPSPLLERFSIYVKTRMHNVVQAPNPVIRRNVMFELRDDLKDALSIQQGMEDCYDILAGNISNVILTYSVMRLWRKRTATRVRKARMATLREQKRRLLEEREKGLGTKEHQWVPVKMKIRPEDDLIAQGDLFRDLNFAEVPLDDIFANPIQKAFGSQGVVNHNFSLLVLNAEPKAEYWWLRKFGVSTGVGIEVRKRKKRLRNSNTFTVERVLQEPEPPTDVGAIIFGCRADYEMSNEERFEADKRDLHLVVDYALRNCRYEKICVMVMCYRSPVDNTEADPYGEDEEGRTKAEGRKMRIKAVRKALGLGKLHERVVVKEVVLVETLEDLNLVPAVKRFAKAAAGAVGSERVRVKKKVEGVPIAGAKAEGAELVPYEEMGVEENGVKHGRQRRPAKRKISVTSPVEPDIESTVVTTRDSQARESPPEEYNVMVDKHPLAIRRKKGVPVEGEGLLSDYFILKSRGVTLPLLLPEKSVATTNGSRDEPYHGQSNSLLRQKLPVITKSTPSNVAEAAHGNGKKRSRSTAPDKPTSQTQSWLLQSIYNGHSPNHVSDSNNHSRSRGRDKSRPAPAPTDPDYRDVSPPNATTRPLPRVPSPAPLRPAAQAPTPPVLLTSKSARTRNLPKRFVARCSIMVVVTTTSTIVVVTWWISITIPWC
ncbi:hypothetical protein BDZ91DRAFT_218794 [Kalaharituber pfeilii]|nr:hypothetical protein BDZ91DRAFT_218794 [Kalaharituber pfeilii]